MPFSDDFNREDGTIIDSVNWFTNDGSDYTVSNNQCRWTTAGTSGVPHVYQDPAALTSADYIVSVDAGMVIASVTQNWLIGARMVPEVAGDDVDGYFMFHFATEISLYKRISGVFTELTPSSRFAHTPTVDVLDAYELEVNGSTITVRLNSTQILQATDTDLTAGGSAGFMMTTPQNSRARYDNLVVTEIGGGTSPTVEAGGPYSGLVSTPIQLNSTVTPGSDPSPTLLWTIDSGGTGTFSSATIADPTFTPDSSGPYVLRLTASTTDTADVFDTANLTSNAAPTVPTVDAGGPYNGAVSTAISLSATVTPGTDPAPTYLWTIQSGGTGTFSDATSLTGTFTPDALGSYVLLLTVSTTDTADVTDTANLESVASGFSNVLSGTFTTLADEPVPPGVNANGPYEGKENAATTLDGLVVAGSDPAPTYLWTIQSGGAGTFSDATSLSSTFTPDSAGTYTLLLTVSTIDTLPVTDTAVFNSIAVVPPTVSAGGPYTGDILVDTQLTGTVTPGDDPSPTLLWEVVGGGTGTFSNATITNPTFTPDAESKMTLRLTATPNDTSPVEAYTIFTTTNYVPSSGDSMTRSPAVSLTKTITKGVVK